MTGSDEVPLLLTRDDILVADVSRLAAAAGVHLDVRSGLEESTRSWLDASVVLVGADSAATVAASTPPRRADVHVVAGGVASDGLFRAAVALGAASVVELPGEDEWLVGVLSDIGDGSRSLGRTVGVIGGSGGVGASVLAGALALVAGRQGPSMLIDLDPLGPGQHRLLGAEDLSGVTWQELADSHGRIGSRSLRDSLPTRAAVGVLGWPGGARHEPPAALVREVVAAGRRGHDWVVLDLPRSGLPLGVLGHCDHLLVLARPDVSSIASAAQVAERVRTETSSVSLVVRVRRSSVDPEDVARAVGLPLVAELGEQRRLDEHLDLGLGPLHDRRSPLARCASRVIHEIGG